MYSNLNHRSISSNMPPFRTGALMTVLWQNRRPHRNLDWQSTFCFIAVFQFSLFSGLLMSLSRTSDHIVLYRSGFKCSVHTHSAGFPVKTNFYQRILERRDFKRSSCPTSRSTEVHPCLTHTRKMFV